MNAPREIYPFTLILLRSILAKKRQIVVMITRGISKAILTMWKAKVSSLFELFIAESGMQIRMKNIRQYAAITMVHTNVVWALTYPSSLFSFPLFSFLKRSLVLEESAEEDSLEERLSEAPLLTVSSPPEELGSLEVVEIIAGRGLGEGGGKEAGETPRPAQPAAANARLLEALLHVRHVWDPAESPCIIGTIIQFHPSRCCEVQMQR